MTARRSIYFVRHGQKRPSATHNSIINKQLKLTDMGRLQASQVGLYLGQHSIQNVYSSDYSRALATATIANDTLELAIVVDQRLGERILLTDDVDDASSKREFVKSQRDWSYHTVGGESLYGVIERFRDAVHAILADSVGDTVVFTHGRALQSYFSNSFPDTSFNQVELIINHGDVYRVDYEDGVPVAWQFAFAPIDAVKDEQSIPTLADTLVIKDSPAKKILKTHITRGTSGSNAQANIYEKNSLDALRALGVRVPGNCKLIDQGRYISMNYISGDTFGTMLSGLKDVHSTSEQLGQLLRSLHDESNSKSYQPAFKINAADPNLNLQCALNFQALTAMATGQSGSDDLYTAFLDAVHIANSVLKKNPYYTRSADIIYGDFKPDNVIVSRRGLIYMIDPHLSYGRRSCDLGKMIARFYLTNSETAPRNTAALLAGYRPEIRMLQEIRDMAGFDILNTYSRLIAKNQLLTKINIPSHHRTLENMARCLREVVPALFGNGNILILRHLDDVQDFRVHYRNTPVKEEEKKKVPVIAHSIIKQVDAMRKKKVHFITSPQLRSTLTAELVAAAIHENAPDFEIDITRDKKIMDLYHGRYVIPDEYEAGEKLPALSTSNKAYIDQTFTHKNLDYRNGDPLDGSYPDLEKLFTEYGETQRSFSARFYEFVASFLEKVENNPETLFLVVTHTAIAFRLFEITYLAKELAVNAGNVALGELSFREWEQAYRIDRNPGNQLFIAPGEIKQLDLGCLLGYSWRFRKETEFLRDNS